VFARMEMTVIAILLFVLSLGMLALKEFADMRQRLEALVEERTRELQEKTLELERQAIRRLGEFRDVANVTDFYLRPESDFITGQVLYLGGVT